MEFSPDIHQPIPQLATKETASLRAEYPCIEHLEAGNIAPWLVERLEQLLSRAKTERAEMNLSKCVTLATASIGAVCYATSPLAPIGALVAGLGYAWSVVQDMTDSQCFAPIPFVRGNFLEFLAAMGDSEARAEWFAGRDEIVDLMNHLAPLEKSEFAMLRQYISTLTDFLTGVEAGKRFYAYRWLLDNFSTYRGAFPTVEQLAKHLAQVAPDPRINHAQVTLIQQQSQQPQPNLPSPKFVELPQPKFIELPSSPQAESAEQMPASQPSSAVPSPQALANMPLAQRASTIINFLKADEFKIDEVVGSQIIAIAGSQRGGKGSLAGILTILSTADNPALKVEYFTAGIDVYPFSCSLHSALSHPGRKADEADKLVARELLQFLKKLENSEPYSNKNLLLVIDEAMRLLSLLEESERSEALQFLLSRFEKTGATLILVLHATNLTAIAGKETGGLAATFKAGINFIGCQTQSVSIGALRKINVASGAYFKANPNNFGEPIKGGELGSIPEWLKIKLHPGNEQPDPVRSLLTFFPELLQEHNPISLPENEKLGELDDISRLEFALTIEPRELADMPKAECDIETKKDLSDLAKRLLSFFDNAKNREPKTLADIKKKDELRQQSDIKLILALSELVDAGHLIFDEKDSWSKHDW